MAVILDDKKNQDQQGQTGNNASATISTGGTSNAAMSGQGGAPAPQSGSGRFVNVQRYWNANQGNQGTQNAVNSFVDKANTAGNQYKASNDSFNNLSVTGPKGYSGDEEQMLSNIASNDPRYSSYAYLKKNANILNNLSGDFENRVGYNGPSSQQVQDAGKNLIGAKSGLDKGIGLVDDNKEARGIRGAELANQYGANGNYTRGQGFLDNSLVERAGSSQFSAPREALKTLAGGYAGNDTVDARTRTLAGQAAEAQNQSDAMRSKFGNIFDVVGQRQQNANLRASKIMATGTDQALQAAANRTQSFGSTPPSSTPAPAAPPPPPSYASSVPTKKRLDTDERKTY